MTKPRARLPVDDVDASGAVDLATSRLGAVHHPARRGQRAHRRRRHALQAPHAREAVRPRRGVRVRARPLAERRACWTFSRYGVCHRDLDRDRDPDAPECWFPIPRHLPRALSLSSANSARPSESPRDAETLRTRRRRRRRARGPLRSGEASSSSEARRTQHEAGAPSASSLLAAAADLRRLTADPHMASTRRVYPSRRARLHLHTLRDVRRPRRRPPRVRSRHPERRRRRRPERPARARPPRTRDEGGGEGVGIGSESESTRESDVSTCAPGVATRRTRSTWCARRVARTSPCGRTAHVPRGSPGVRGRRPIGTVESAPFNSAPSFGTPTGIATWDDLANHAERAGRVVGRDARRAARFKMEEAAARGESSSAGVACAAWVPPGGWTAAHATPRRG